MEPLPDARVNEPEPKEPRLPPATVAAIDDDAEAIAEIERSLESHPDVRVRGFVRFDAECKAALQSPDLHGVVLDWILYGVDKGPDIIHYVRQKAPDLATLVSTRFEEKERSAFNHGADGFRLRRGHSNLVDHVEKTVRLTFRRRIAARLAKCATAPAPGAGLLASIASEEELFERSRRALFESVARGTPIDAELRTLLVQRGWWRSFDVRSYSRRPFLEKVTELLAFANLDPRILNTARESSRQAEGPDLPDAGSVFGPVEKLAAILGYGLRVVRYEAELLPLVFSADCQLARPGTESPWKVFGLNDYLLKSGLDGIDEAHRWLMEV